MTDLKIFQIVHTTDDGNNLDQFIWAKDPVGAVSIWNSEDGLGFEMENWEGDPLEPDRIFIINHVMPEKAGIIDWNEVE